MDNEEYRLDDFYRKYSDMILRYVCSKLENRSASEDISQETFLRLSENLDHIPPEKVKAWLFCVADHLVIDYLKKGGRQRTCLELAESRQIEAANKSSHGPEYVMLQKEEYEGRARVLKLMKKEKPNWYEVICMSYLGDMDNKAIAKLLGIRPSLVSKWKERGKRWLREAYSRDEENSK